MRGELVVGVAVGVQEEDRERVDALAPRAALRDRLELGLVERREHVARRVDPLVHLEAQRALDQRPVLAEEQVVRLAAG